jgi:uncharacterized protein YbbC (DUF1343 family)
LGSCSGVGAYQLGIDTVTAQQVQQVAACHQPRIGLLTNQTGRDSKGRATVDVLRSHGMLVQRLFVPEHGLHGTIPASAGVKTMRDKRTGLEVVGLMKNDGSLEKIDPSKLKDIDVFMVDLQDIGMRHFTYSGFLFYLMEVAEHTKKPLIILDRPNPLGAGVEGPVVKRVENSLIARAPLPLRHGLTMGELARFYNSMCLAGTVNVHVIALKDYTRTDIVDDALVAQLSPNVQHKQAAYAYSFLGALGEVRPFDVGIDTEHAMNICALSLEVMPHESFWTKLALKLKNLGLDTTLCCYWSPRKNGWCRGLQLVAKNEPPQRSFEVLLTIVDAARRAGVALTFAPFFDRAVGDPLVKRYLQGKLSKQDLAKAINKQLTRYQAKLENVLLYQPAPLLQKLS